MFRYTIVGLALFALVGCGYPVDLEKLLGVDSPAPAPAPASPTKKLDCDLIFP
jgi:hypothetical protein